MTATVYLLHLTPPYKHARHYCGWTGRPLEERLRDHHSFQGRDQGGKGSSLLAAQTRVGGGWVVARTWTFRSPGEARAYERRIKHSAGTKYCPLCRAQAKATSAQANDGGLSVCQ